MQHAVSTAAPTPTGRLSALITSARVQAPTVTDCAAAILARDRERQFARATTYVETQRRCHLGDARDEPIAPTTNPAHRQAFDQGVVLARDHREDTLVVDSHQ